MPRDQLRLQGRSPYSSQAGPDGALPELPSAPLYNMPRDQLRLQGRSPYSSQAGPDGALPELPSAPLYNMPRDQLLEIRKQVIELMDKGWIRASSSSAAAPVLLVKKGAPRRRKKMRVSNPCPSTRSPASEFLAAGLAACCTEVLTAALAERHPDPLETNMVICLAIAAFGANGTTKDYLDEHLTAFRDTLGDFATAYLGDVLIYSGGSKKDHLRKVREVLRRLRDAGLKLDIEKCSSGVKEVKYLGFMVEAGRAIRPDPEKIATIRDWEPPTRAKGVRSFLGFANFYREFIPNFSDLAGPLLALTHKGALFVWPEACADAFERLKSAFISYPVLAQWDPERDTVAEADSSGEALGGCLSQYSDKGVLHPVAYHSA
ncbi:uncharacterized protein CPUR_02929 [Claviceps purpurea 20.1]|uniref:Uncharacterized protein n=1 Tax=Claviceps purpurea (strain 20.1) TaxID=1111077 RepID=M1W0D0_CLAP2|nr:uncharacterized protein CPUR_02929 [Claviceps purpurea 20.1]